ncbi:hypothetical protein F5Y19DRAFT_262579 [Xylariaceae sp. FL1651]|nr:hypothetical protein F5Y19DRAFT_262579 [Xylariaceae sp. FL1651]
MAYMLNQPPPRRHTAGRYRTLHDASRANLPPRPPTTPNWLLPRTTAYMIPPNQIAQHPPPKYRRGRNSARHPVYTPVQLTLSKDLSTFSGRNSYNEEKIGTKRARAPEAQSSTSSMAQALDDIVYRAHIGVQRLYGKLLAGATTLTAQEQQDLYEYIDFNSPRLPKVMELVVQQVPKKTKSLSAKVMLWAQKNGEFKLLEDETANRLFIFDLEEAIEEPLMSSDEVSELMECLFVREWVVDYRSNEMQGIIMGVDANAVDESDNDSMDMDLSDG